MSDSMMNHRSWILDIRYRIGKRRVTPCFYPTSNIQHPTSLLNESGFTLVEVLVAVAVLMIVIGAIYGAFRAGNQSSVMVQEDADLHQTARVLLGRMTSELSSVYTLASVGTSGCAIQGTSAADNGYPAGFDTLTFATLSHQPCCPVSQNGDVCTVTYSAQCTSDGTPTGLFLTEDYTMGLSSAVTSSSALPSMQVSPLVVGMICTYLDPTTNEWQDDWVNQTTLPSAVRIELILQTQRKGAQPISVASTINLKQWN